TRFEHADASELGQIAKALTIFDHNGQQLQQSMAREREDAQRTARAAERWERLRADLQFAVDRATVGDFSARLPNQSGDPDIDALAMAVNTLLETVAAGLEENGR